MLLPIYPPMKLAGNFSLLATGWWGVHTTKQLSIECMHSSSSTLYVTHTLLNPTLVFSRTLCLCTWLGLASRRQWGQWCYNLNTSLSSRVMPAVGYQNYHQRCRAYTLHHPASITFIPSPSSLNLRLLLVSFLDLSYLTLANLSFPSRPVNHLFVLV